MDAKVCILAHRNELTGRNLTKFARMKLGVSTSVFDAKGLGEVFSNVADQITIGELIASGHLVPPRTFVIDVGA